MSKNTVKAVCVVEIQVACDSVWTEDTTMQQIIKQAESDATHRIGKLFSDAGNADAELSTRRAGVQGLSFLGIKKIVTQAVVDR
jgi:hypothetical protein